jgi:hypothetical protein
LVGPFGSERNGGDEKNLRGKGDKARRGGFHDAHGVSPDVLGRLGVPQPD